jgi:hypothetical protein
MERLTLDTGESPHILIRTIGGDLRLVGNESTTLEAQAASKGAFTASREGGRFEVTCREGCLIFLPTASEVEVESIGGDVRVTGLGGALRLGEAGGDVSLRRVGSVHIARIGGDLLLHRAAGDLAAERVGGDARIDLVDGAVRIDSVGGDLHAGEVSGAVSATTGGDARLELAPPPGSVSDVRAGGDIACRVAPGASARLTLKAGGDLDLGGASAEQRPEGTTVTLGTGEASVSLTAGGDLRLRLSDVAWTNGWGPSIREDIEAAVHAQLDAAMADMQTHLRFAGRQEFDAERFAERFGRSLHRHGSRGPRRQEDQTGARSAGFEAEESGEVTDDERMSVLRMLETGKITVEQAEKLFQGLEGKA